MPAPLPLPWDLPAPEKGGRPSAWALLPEDLETMGCPGRPEHVFHRLQRVASWKEHGPWVSKEIRAWLAEHTDLSLPELAEAHPSGDASTKAVLRLTDGHRIEAVHMPRRVRNPRVTLCLSSQVGCAMGCTFCATGAMGILRNLTAGEIVGEVLALQRALGPQEGSQLTLVFMGMGEPLHNLDHVHRAIRVLCHPAGMGLSARRITVSTSGLVRGIDRLATLEPRPLLALSLNATTDEARGATMPVNRVWNLAALRAALDRWGLRKGEKLTFEYVLLAGVNDTDGDADRLAAWLGDLRHGHNLNLIPMNEHEHAPFHEPQEARIQAFSDRLKALGCFVTVRRSRGRDVRAACGQLVKDRLEARGSRKPTQATSHKPRKERRLMLPIPVHILPHGEGLDLPAHATIHSAGMDLRAALGQDETWTLQPFERRMVPTGLVLALPDGFEGQIRPRSGLARNHGVTLLNSPGTLDADYRGELQVLVINLGQAPFELKRGERIAQLVVAPYQQARLEPVAGLEALGDTARGAGGFGSTGRG